MPDTDPTASVGADLYLDYAATTPLDEVVLAEMLPFFDTAFANPSSVHRAGQRVRSAVEDARERVAAAIGAQPKSVVFTSGATEADNQALRSALASRPGALLTSPLEHAAVLTSARALAEQGREVHYLTPDHRGAITPAIVEEALARHPGTTLVALMLVNNETGVRTDVAQIAERVHRAGALLFCDAVQGFGFEAIEVEALGADLLSLSGHKVYGPKGVGVLYVRAGLELAPLILGGEQERGRRAGTLNVPAIVGMGAAAERAASGWRSRARAVAALRDDFERRLAALPGVGVNGGEAPRGPKHSNLRIAGVDGETLLMSLDTLGIYASAGSACAAGSLEPSHVLLAMGVDPEAAKASVRFSFGPQLGEADVAEAAERVERAIQSCRTAPPA